MIEAAGGILWRDATRTELVVVHRKRYGDWCLPKGKVGAGETPEQAALREVREETGWEPRLGTPAGELHYRVGADDKTVRFWNMTPVRESVRSPPDPEEVEEARWMAVADGLRRLSYERERQIVRDNLPDRD